MSAGTIDQWGPALWRFLHASSFAYPELPDEPRQRQMLAFLRGVGDVLPCKTCRDHYREYVDGKLTPADVSSRAALVSWLVELHNSVNRRVGKREWTVAEASALYETREGRAGACPAVRHGSLEFGTWICVVLVAATLGLVVASQVRRLPN